MIIRQFEPNDITQLKIIHEKYYKDEFRLVDFCTSFIDFFVIAEDDKIISAGGVRAIAESVIMTNKECEIDMKRAALIQMLQAQLFTCGRLNFAQLHAFVQDKNWERHLIRAGFRPCKGNALFIEAK